MTIQKSEQLGELFSALSIVQGAVEQAERNSQGYNHKYADLGEVIKVSQKLLKDNGLCVIQIPGEIEIIEVTEKFNNTYNVVKLPKQKIYTWIGHTSGQYMSTHIEIIAEKTQRSWGQSIGAVITFARRYVRAAMLGISQEDNDNENTNFTQNETQRSKSKQNDKSSSVGAPPSHRISPQVAINLKERLKDDPERAKSIMDYYKIRDLSELSPDQYGIVISRLEVSIPSETNSELITQLITQEQINYMKSILSSEKLYEVLKHYKLSRLENMTLKDYQSLKDKIRLGEFNIIKTDQEEAA